MLMSDLLRVELPIQACLVSNSTTSFPSFRCLPLDFMMFVFLLACEITNWIVIGAKSSRAIPNNSNSSVSIAFLWLSTHRAANYYILIINVIWVVPLTLFQVVWRWRVSTWPSRRAFCVRRCCCWARPRTFALRSKFTPESWVRLLSQTFWQEMKENQPLSTPL